jgi:hypothetical protein
VKPANDYWGHMSRWLVSKFAGVWVVCPPRHIRADYFASWREAMDFVIQEAGL